MVTKWKNRVRITLLSLFIAYGLSGVATTIIFGSDYTYKDYYHTPWFQEQLHEFTKLITIFEVYDLSLNEAKTKITVTQEEIEEHRFYYGSLAEQIENIEAQYEDKIKEAQLIEDTALLSDLLSERDGKLEDITNNFQSDEHVEKKIKKEKEKELEEYYEARESYRDLYLQRKKEFLYYFKGSHPDEVYTNVNKQSSIKDLEYYVDYNLSGIDFAIMDESGVYDEAVNTILPTIGDVQGRIGVSNHLTESSQLYREAANYEKSRLILGIYFVTSVVLLVIGVILLKKSTIELDGKLNKLYQFIPIDLKITSLFLMFIATIIVSFLINLNGEVFYYYNYLELSVSIIILAMLVIAVVIQWRSVRPLILSKKEWESSLIKKIWNYYLVGTEKVECYVTSEKESIKNGWGKLSFRTQVLLIIGLFFFLGLSSIMVAVHPIFLLIYIPLIGFVGVPLVFKLLDCINTFTLIYEKSAELVSGRTSPELTINGNSILAKLSININKIQQAVQHSQSEQAKSERLKTELITNVSHDLRTPLTSIITYTELLKKEFVDETEKKKYLTIIDQKSKRLKVLIDDLFEVSRMASGNIELKKEQVDIVQLLQQTLAEHNDKMEESSLQFRVTHDEKPVYVLVDGQKMWRVFDNLIANILKYSLEQSRVYIKSYIDEKGVNITFKNISKYEIIENSNELSERFKRGDASRHTDGSGLGLAIAKSIIELHNGKLTIETDGDLFKVTICLELLDNPMFK